jgi:hypothetical protein
MRHLAASGADLAEEHSLFVKLVTSLCSLLAEAQLSQTLEQDATV